MEKNTKHNSWFYRVYHLYYDGFTTLSNWAKVLWIIIIVKIIILFGVFKFWFTPNYLDKRFSKETDKANYVLEQLINNVDRNDN